MAPVQRHHPSPHHLLLILVLPVVRALLEVRAAVMMAVALRAVVAVVPVLGVTMVVAVLLVQQALQVPPLLHLHPLIALAILPAQIIHGVPTAVTPIGFLSLKILPAPINTKIFPVSGGVLAILVEALPLVIPALLVRLLQPQNLPAPVIQLNAIICSVFQRVIALLLIHLHLPHHHKQVILPVLHHQWVKKANLMAKNLKKN